MRIDAKIIAGAIIGVLSFSLNAEPIVSQTVQKFVIEGKISKRLKKQMSEAQSIQNLDGTILPTSTWAVRWNYDFEEKNKSCKLFSIQTKIEIAKIEPVWRNGEVLTEKQKELWDLYLMQLQRNELSQREAVYRAAKEIEKSSLKLKARDSCEELSSAVNTLGQGILAKHRGAEVREDLKIRLASID